MRNLQELRAHGEMANILSVMNAHIFTLEGGDV